MKVSSVVGLSHYPMALNGWSHPPTQIHLSYRRSFYLLNVWMNLVARKILCGCLLALFVRACPSTRHIAPSAAPSAPSQATPKTKPYVAYLRDGDLWLIQSDGTDQRLATAAPEGEAIQDFVWGVDGDRIYFSAGGRLYEVILQTGNLASAGELIVPQGISPQGVSPQDVSPQGVSPQGVSIDSLEMGRDGKTIIVRTLDANAAARLFAVTIGERAARELTVDEYNSMIRPRPPTIRAIGEMSVSPDGRLLLFKDVVGSGEELFVADAETGARVKVTNLYELSGFEESVETEGGRRVIGATWSPDSRYIIFNPMQSCSDSGLCYGRLVLVDALGGAQRQLSSEMMVDLPSEWAVEWPNDNYLLIYDDGSRIVVSNAAGNQRTLAEGHHPKLRP
jgi:Tol biopolymer transport system component